MTITLTEFQKTSINQFREEMTNLAYAEEWEWQARKIYDRVEKGIARGFKEIGFGQPEFVWLDHPLDVLAAADEYRVTVDKTAPENLSMEGTLDAAMGPDEELLSVIKYLAYAKFVPEFFVDICVNSRGETIERAILWGDATLCRFWIPFGVNPDGTGKDICFLSRPYKG